MIAPRVVSLIKVYETGSFTKAAALLGRTQPAVSQHICALESQFGITIFDRSHSPLTVTPEGMYVINAARKIIDAVDELEDTLDRYRNGSRTLHVGLTSSEELYGITDAISDVLLENDNLSIDTTRHVFDYMMNMLYKGEIDMAISFGDIEVSSDYGKKILDKDHLVLAVASGNPLAERKSVTLREILDQKLVTFPPATGIGRYFHHAVSAAELSIDNSNLRFVTYDIDAISKVVASGKAVAVVPEKLFRKKMKEDTVLVPVDEIKDDIPLNLYFNVSTGFSKIVDRIIDKYSRI